MKVWRIVRAAWVLICLVVLAYSIIQGRRAAIPYDLGTVHERELVCMLALSYPSSLLALMAFLYLYGLATPHDPTGFQWILVIWAPLFLAGYLQWFVLVPALVRSIRKYRDRRRGLGLG